MRNKIKVFKKLVIDGWPLWVLIGICLLVNEDTDAWPVLGLYAGIMTMHFIITTEAVRRIQ